MDTVGKIAEIWRYPVSSLGGELCESTVVGSRGIEGDRQYALFDPASGVVAAPEKEPRWRAALFLRSAGSGDAVRIGFPDGCWLDLHDRRLLPMLEAHFGFKVAIGRYGSECQSTAFLPQIGNRYDLAPLHVITTASLAALQAILPDVTIDQRRFRPNVLIRTGTCAGFAETEWIGRALCLADVTLRATEATKRCGLTLVAQPQLEEEPDILRAILRHNKRTLGIYCTVETPGRIALGGALSK
ncbi:MOSC domain-containing protein [Neorhizobium sp. NPDC001467]|uniref:MOSC domain-containing protein n=1 Tax=Neorhizobium sp. NPDC001467 TaxID=3390595 RepID=UPI003D051717